MASFILSSGSYECGLEVFTSRPMRYRITEPGYGLWFEDVPGQEVVRLVVWHQIPGEEMHSLKYPELGQQRHQMGKFNFWSIYSSY